MWFFADDDEPYFFSFPPPLEISCCFAWSYTHWQCLAVTVLETSLQMGPVNANSIVLPSELV